MWYNSTLLTDARVSALMNATQTYSVDSKTITLTFAQSGGTSAGEQRVTIKVNDSQKLSQMVVDICLNGYAVDV